MHAIAICDDNAFDRERILKCIGDYFKLIRFQLPNISIYGSGEELIQSIKNKKTYDIIFLDVNMDGLDGMKTAESIRQYLPDVFIAFVSAFLKYSLDGYKIGAFRYIIKSNLEVSIKECMSSVCQRVQVERPLLLEAEEGIRWIKPAYVFYIESDMREIRFHVKTDEGREIYNLHGKLSEYETNPTFTGFIRIHKSFLINPAYIDSVRRYSVRLKSGEELAIPKARFKDVLDRITAYRGAV